jgi:hypothetical protein
MPYSLRNTVRLRKKPSLPIKKTRFSSSADSLKVPEAG